MKRILSLLAMLLSLGPAVAHEALVGPLQIIHPHIPATAVMTAGGFMVVVNSGTEADRLIGVESDIAAKVGLHESKVDATGVATMSHVEAIDLPAGETVNLEHGGYHIMFMGLNAPLTEGQMVKVTLIFELAGRAEVEFMVDPPGEDGGHAHGHGDHSAMMVPMTGDPIVDIAAVMKAQFDTPENPLIVAPISVQGETAIAGWAQGDKGGRAFLRMGEMGWSIEVCAGSGLLKVEMLTGLGLSETDAATLLAAVNAAGTGLGANAIALFDSFDGEMFFTE